MITNKPAGYVPGHSAGIAAQRASAAQGLEQSRRKLVPADAQARAGAGAVQFGPARAAFLRLVQRRLQPLPPTPAPSHRPRLPTALYRAYALWQDVTECGLRRADPAGLARSGAAIPDLDARLDNTLFDEGLIAYSRAATRPSRSGCRLAEEPRPYGAPKTSIGRPRIRRATCPMLGGTCVEPSSRDPGERWDVADGHHLSAER